MCPMMYVRMTARPQPPHNRPARPTPPRPPCAARFGHRGGGSDPGAVDGDGWHGDGSLEALRAGEIVGRWISVHLVTQLGKTRQPGFGFSWLIHGNHEPVDGHTAIPALFFARHRRGLSGFCRILSVLGGQFSGVPHRPNFLERRRPRGFVSSTPTSCTERPTTIRCWPARICCTSTSTRRWTRHDRPRFRPGPSLRARPGFCRHTTRHGTLRVHRAGGGISLGSR